MSCDHKWKLIPNQETVFCTFFDESGYVMGLENISVCLRCTKMKGDYTFDCSDGSLRTSRVFTQDFYARHRENPLTPQQFLFCEQLGRKVWNPIDPVEFQAWKELHDCPTPR